MYRKYKVRSRRYKRKYRRNSKVSKYRKYRTRKIAKKALRKAQQLTAQSFKGLYNFEQGPVSMWVNVAGGQYSNHWNLMSPGGTYGYALGTVNQLFYQNAAALSKPNAFHKAMLLDLMIQINNQDTITPYTFALIRPTKSGEARINMTTGLLNGGLNEGTDWAGEVGRAVWNKRLWKVLWQKQWYSGVEINVGQHNPIKKYKIYTKNRTQLYNPNGVENPGLNTWTQSVVTPKLTENVFLVVLSQQAAGGVDAAPQFSFNNFHWVDTAP